MLRLLHMTTITALESEADSAGDVSPAAADQGMLIYLAGPYTQPDRFLSHPELSLAKQRHFHSPKMPRYKGEK